MTKDEKKQIETVMKNFNFERVHKAMKHLNWKWAFVAEEDRVPSLMEIKNQARKMLKDAVTSTPYSTGGFEVSYSGKGDILSLKFCLEEYYA